MTADNASANPLLAVAGLHKSFGEVRALVDVSLEVAEGEVVGLVGENGAGKSTLMRILAGVQTPDRGTLRLRGEPVSLRDARDAGAHGIGIVFQEQSLLPNLSVAENIYLGQEGPFTRAGFLRRSRLHEAARRQLGKIGVEIDPAARTSELPFAARQMVELAKALTLEERTQQSLLILLDEPTSVLEQRDIAVLFERVRALKERRAGIVFVSHRLDEVLAVSDRVYVLKDGQVVAGLPAAGATTGELHQLMVGRERETEYYRESQQQPPRPEVAMEARGLTVQGSYADVDFTVRRGEVLGIVGVVGSGREELTRTLFGFLPQTAGQLEVRGRPVRLRVPAEAKVLGIGYIPRERKVEGLVAPFSIAANVTLARLCTLGRSPVLLPGREREVGERWFKRLRVRAPGTSTRCQDLSGGNQQKVVLGKWLHAEADILILDHPTRGLDVGAKEEVYDLVRELCAQGIAVVLTSDTLEEATGLSHHLLVMRDGRVTARFDASPGRKPTQVELIEHMV